MNYDVIVVGAGSMGMAAGYYLASSGKKTLLLDAHQPPHNKGSHHGETRIIRYAYGEGEEYVPFVLQAKELWEDLERTTGKNLLITTGVLNVGHHTSNFIKNTVISSQKFSLPLELLNAKQIQERWSGITLSDDYIGSFEPTSGVLRCEDCIQAYHELAVSSGATIIGNSRVKDMKIQNDKVIIKTEDDQTHHAESLVISAGAWSKELLLMLELDLIVTPIRKTFAWYEANELYHQHHFPAFAFETTSGIYYGFPNIDGVGLKVGRHDGGEVVDPNMASVEFGRVSGDEEDLNQFLYNYMPEVGQLKYGKTCMYTLTPDEKFNH